MKKGNVRVAFFFVWTWARAGKIPSEACSNACFIGLSATECNALPGAYDRPLTWGSRWIVDLILSDLLRFLSIDLALQLSVGYPGRRIPSRAGHRLATIHLATP
jgi:hypothetical protein